MCSNFRDSDIVIGALNSNMNVLRRYISTISYFYDQAQFCLKLPVPLPRWQYLFLITNSNQVFIWHFGASALILAAIVFFLYSGNGEKKMISFATSILWVLASVMAVSLPLENISLKYILVRFGIISTFFMNNAVFFNILLKPCYSSKFGTVGEVLSSDFQFITTMRNMVDSISL